MQLPLTHPVPSVQACPQAPQLRSSTEVSMHCVGTHPASTAGLAGHDTISVGQREVHTPATQRSLTPQQCTPQAPQCSVFTRRSAHSSGAPAAPHDASPAAHPPAPTSVAGTLVSASGKPASVAGTLVSVTAIPASVAGTFVSDTLGPASVAGTLVSDTLGPASVAGALVSALDPRSETMPRSDVGVSRRTALMSVRITAASSTGTPGRAGPFSVHATVARTRQIDRRGARFMGFVGSCLEAVVWERWREVDSDVIAQCRSSGARSPGDWEQAMASLGGSVGCALVSRAASLCATR